MDSEAAMDSARPHNEANLDQSDDQLRQPSDDNPKTTAKSSDAAETSRQDRQQQKPYATRDAQDGDGNGDVDGGVEGTTQSERPAFLASWVARLGLDKSTVLMMLKGSLPPTIGIAIYQSTAVANYFGSFGYLLPIVTVIALPILPRGKFVMNLVLILGLICLASAVSLLALWSGVQARNHTTPPGVDPLTSGYNPSQAVVCGIWLFANIWFINLLRAKLPSFNLPGIIYSILVNVAMTSGYHYTSTVAVEIFVKKLLTVMMAALAISLGINLVVFPVSSRLVLFKELAGCIGLLRKTVALQKAYLVRLESDDMFTMATRTETMIHQWEKAGKRHKPRLTKEAEAAKALQETVASLKALAGKLNVDTPFAKRDIAWGKMSAKDLGVMIGLFRSVYIPVLGMTTMTDIFKRVSERRGWVVDESMPAEILAEKEMERRVWNSVMQQMREPFDILSEALDQGLLHAALCLELIPRPKANSKNGANIDVEAKAGQVKPGEPGFAKIIDEKVKAFSSKKGKMLREWVSQRELAIEEEMIDNPGYKCSAGRSERDQVQLYIILFMENLMHTAGMAVQDLITFADGKVQDGTMKRSRLIVPTLHRLRKWVVGILSSEDSSAEEAPGTLELSHDIVFFGDGYNQKKDPEHLPPVTTWQHFGNGLRKFPNFFGSEESVFGFRVACATMTVGIVAYLESTERFFIEQRLVWAMIIIAIGMTMTSGQSFFGFLCRVGGTVIAMCTSLVIWYIVDGHTAGAIVFLWLFTFVDFYFLLKYPRFIPAIIISMITQILIVGYELQAVKIGKEATERSGQPFYPTYTLAPYRLACVAGGSLVAFIWTIFPSPLTDGTWLRRDLSATLYLIANYFSVVNSTLQSKLDDTEGDISDRNSPAYQLLKARYKIHGKLMMIIPSMAEHAEWQKWEPTIGGKFPREAYEELILRSTRIMSYLTLMAYTLTHSVSLRPESWENDGARTSDDRNNNTTGSSAASVSSNNRAWLNAVAEVFASLSPTHHNVLSTLTLLSNSLLSGQSLPPFLPLPRPYELTRRLMNISHNVTGSCDQDREDEPLLSGDKGILDPRHMEQPGYAEFAALQVCTALMCDDLDAVMKAVSGLVGVVDFSFRVREKKQK
ncbi:hypothetical protein B0H66DRAFT_358322 [Apodospora peruviana]|uniref:ER transporter 6TM N-terminal domain-containing protein n=1 Tax=Apodospora peruviana TaxID=516989 RepID=A0AAE0HVK3_9PEZI|nr:hypothetical protein B0H66DRAFT_358322 [Apodospora peruviana]